MTADHTGQKQSVLFCFIDDRELSDLFCRVEIIDFNFCMQGLIISGVDGDIIGCGQISLEGDSDKFILVDRFSPEAILPTDLIKDTGKEFSIHIQMHCIRSLDDFTEAWIVRSQFECVTLSGDDVLE